MDFIRRSFTCIAAFLVLPFIFAVKTYAFCPVCTVAVGAGVGLSRWLGIDDTITGLWVGGLTVSMIMWTINWLNSKNIKFIGRKILVTLLYYLFIVVPLFYTGIMGHPLNKIWGIDRLLVGIIFGSFAFLAAVIGYDKIKEKRGKPYFHFQKVAMPLVTLLILSGLFYIIFKK